MTLLLSSFAVNAETWSCSYLHDGKANTTVFAREGNSFINPTTSVTDKIIYEDDKTIQLHTTYSPTSSDYFAILLDKEKKMFAMVMLQIGSHSDIIEGECQVY